MVTKTVDLPVDPYCATPIEKDGVTYRFCTNTPKQSFNYEVCRRLKRAGDLKIVIRPEAFDVSENRLPKHSAVYVAEDDISQFHRMIRMIEEVIEQFPEATREEFFFN